MLAKCRRNDQKKETSPDFYRHSVSSNLHGSSFLYIAFRDVVVELNTTGEWNGYLPLSIILIFRGELLGLLAIRLVCEDISFLPFLSLVFTALSSITTFLDEDMKIYLVNNKLSTLLPSPLDLNQASSPTLNRSSESCRISTPLSTSAILTSSISNFLISFPPADNNLSSISRYSTLFLTLPLSIKSGGPGRVPPM